MILGDCDSVRDGRYVGGVEGLMLGGRVENSVEGEHVGDLDGDVKDDEFDGLNVGNVIDDGAFDGATVFDRYNGDNVGLIVGISVKSGVGWNAGLKVIAIVGLVVRA